MLYIFKLSCLKTQGNIGKDSIFWHIHYLLITRKLSKNKPQWSFDNCLLLRKLVKMQLIASILDSLLQAAPAYYIRPSRQYQRYRTTDRPTRVRCNFNFETMIGVRVKLRFWWEIHHLWTPNNQLLTKLWFLKFRSFICIYKIYFGNKSIFLRNYIAWV